MQEDCILYDFLQPAEWDVRGDYHHDQQKRSQSPANVSSLVGYVAAFARGSVSLFFKLLRLPFSGRGQDAFQSLISLLESRIPWHLNLSKDGRHLAILQDSHVEIRSSDSEFARAVKVEIGLDLYPQWRRLAWSPDGNFLVCVSSSGCVHLISASGRLLLSTDGTTSDGPKVTKFSALSAPSGVQCIKCRPGSSGLFQVVVVSYDGLLKNYLIKSHLDCILQHTFSFGNHLPGVIAAVHYSDMHNMLLIGSCSYEAKKSRGGSRVVSAVTSWRLLDGVPFYTRALESSNANPQKTQATMVARLRRLTLSKLPVSHQDLVFEMAVSPNGLLLATIDCEGKLAIWRLPSLELLHQWSFGEQPDHEVTATIPSSFKHRKGPDFYLNVNWWSDESVILSRRSGAVTVVALEKNLLNLLGLAPEQFEPGCALTHSTGSGFFILECEGTVKAPRLLSFGDQVEGSPEHKGTAINAVAEEEMLVKRVVREVLFYVTESDRFRPRRKRPRVVHRAYRLFFLQSMSPEELFHRKISQEEYGEAVALAQRFDLDADLVYQTQWKACQVSKASIADYLAKISDIDWVLRECLTRVPDDFDATRELLLFGLEKTNIWDVVGAQDEHALEMDPQISPTKKETEYLKKVDASRFNSHQLFLCHCRKMLFSYLDRLSTYEVVLGGPIAADERFSKEQFRLFRSRNLLEAAVSYAQNGDWQAVQALCTHHGDAVLSHRLAILSSFPETLPPSEYESLLPEISLDDPTSVVEWEQELWRPADWVEKDHINTMLEAEDDSSNNAAVVSRLYTTCPALQEFNSPLSVGLVSSWFHKRAEEIENLSGQVGNSLHLVKFGIEKGVSGLEKLRDDLMTLETIVYECGSASYLSLNGLRNLPYDRQLDMMMEKSVSNTELFVSWFSRFALPFLERTERHHPGASFPLMKNFLVEKLRDDLKLCLAVCKESSHGRTSLVSNKEDLMEIALACVYACERTDQLAVACQIFECLPSKDSSDESERMRALHVDVDRLEDILCGAELLQNNDIQKPVHYLKNIENDTSEAHQLMVKLSRTASRKSPPPSQQEWKQVLRDMLSLQQHVFKCLDPSVCYNVFAESLLCCGRTEGIALAGSLLTSSSKVKPEKGKGMRLEKEKGSSFAVRLPFEKSVELVLSAAKEYFNSATSLTDRDMDLAKSCLALLDDRPPDVQAELDLISALSVLSDFGVKMLPLQVRLATKKLAIVEEALKQPKAYKSPAKLEKLGQLLGVSSVSEVRVLVGEASIHKEDYKVAATMCQLLMDEKHKEAWHVCRQLGECSKFDDLSFRKDLFAFSLTHCPADQIESLLRASGVLEVQAMLVDTAKSQEDSSLQATWNLVGRGAGAVHNLVGRGAGAVSGLVSRSAGAVESLVSSRMETRVTRSAGELMSQCLSWMQKTSRLLKHSTSQRDVVNEEQETLPEESDEHDGTEEMSTECYVQSSHPFYHSLISADLDVQHLFDYNILEERRGSDDQQLVVDENLVRMAKVAEARCKGEKSEPTADALIQLAARTLRMDITLALGYLLALPQAELAEECFHRLSPTQLSLQCAIYFYALNVYAAAIAAECSPSLSTPHPYCHSPSDVVRHVTEHASQQRLSEWSAEVQNMMCRLTSHQEKLIDFRYAQKLQQLDSSIDSSLFAQDEQYRQQTVLSLSRSVEDETYSTALAVAKRYKVPVFDVLFSHVSWLLTQSGMNVGMVEQRLQSLDVLPVLLNEHEKFADCLRGEVYPELPGSNLNGLLCYFSLLLQCVERGAKDESPVSVESHIKLLKRLKQAVSGLDYKMLMCGYDVEEVLRPVLTSANVHVFAKASNSIPSQGAYLTPSAVFLIYCKKLFWEGEGKPSDESKPSHWVHRYEACQEYAQRLTADDFNELLDDIVCSQQATQLPLVSRMDVVRRAVKFAKLQASGKKKPSMGASKEPENMSYQEVADQINVILNHLQSLEDPMIQQWMTSDEEKLRGYAIQYDLTAANKDKLLLLVESMFHNEETPEMIVELLQLADGVNKHQLTLQSVLETTVSGLLETLSVPEYGCEGLDQLARVTRSVSTHVKSRGELLSQESLLSLVRPFCANLDLPVEPRTAVLQLLEQNFDLGDGDSSLLLFYRSEAIVSTMWQHTITLESVNSATAQALLFDELLASSDTLEQFQGLLQLILIWTVAPPGAAGRLLSSTLKCSSQEVPLAVVTMRKSLHRIDFELDRKLFNDLCGGDLFLATCYSFITPHSELHRSGIEILKQEPATPENEELCELLLMRRQAVHLISTPYYDAFIKHLLSYQKSPPEGVNLERLDKDTLCPDDDENEVSGSSRVDDVVHQLHEAGLWSQAGSLLLASQDVHPLLRTMDSAIHALTSLFRK